MQIKNRTPSGGLEKPQPATREIGERRGEGDGGGVIGNDQFDPSPLITFVEIGTGKAEELAVPLDSVCDILRLTGTAGTFDRPDGPEKTVPGTTKGR